MHLERKKPFPNQNLSRSLAPCQKAPCLSMCHIGHQIFVSKICCTSPFCPPELWILIQGNLRLVVPELLAKASEKTDGMWKSITPHNITHFVNKWICFDSMCMSDRVTCSLPIWTSSTPLPKRAVIYGSWALHSCVLWCLIQGPTTRQGGERGCVGNSRGLGSSGTLISYKYSLCCSHWFCLCDCWGVTPCRV